MLSCVHPPVHSTRSFLGLHLGSISNLYPDWKGHVWMHTAGWQVMDLYMPRTESDFGVKAGEEDEALEKGNEIPKCVDSFPATNLKAKELQI